MTDLEALPDPRSEGLTATPVPTTRLAAPAFDREAMCNYRLGRLRQQMALNGVDLLILLNPISLRYAVDWTEFPTFQSHIQFYDLFVEPDGRTTMFGGYSADYRLPNGTENEPPPPLLDESRPGHALNSFDGGLDLTAEAKAFADDVAAVAPPGGRVAIEHINPTATRAVADHGFDVVDATPLVEAARYIKSPDEIICIRHSIAVAQLAMATMRALTRPGLTESQLYAVLHHVNIANGGEWIEGRLLTSGPRTNPWYRSASDRTMQAGEIVAFDTDLIGPNGYCADISRSWLVGDPVDSVTPTTTQQDLYRRAHAEIEHNAALLRPGTSFRALSEQAYRQDEQFVAHRYTGVFHGVGLCDEYPKISHQIDWETKGYDGELAPNTVLSVESFVGSDRGGEGVKLEDMCLITETGPERLSTFPFEERLLR